MISNTFTVGKFTCKLSIDEKKPEGLSAEWTPHVPNGMSNKMWRQYRAGREALLKELGLNILVVE